MSRERLLSAIRLLMQQEQRSGIGYWCDPGLEQALRAVAVRPRVIGTQSTAPAPGASARQRSAPARQSSASARQPAASARQSSTPARQASPGTQRRFARPPARLDPDAPARATARRAKVERPQWGPPPEATGRDPDWKEKLAAIDKEVHACTLCPLAKGRTNTVFGVGEASVPLVFVGEAPGAEEDRQGLPFVGRAGGLLTRIIEAIGLTREQVYICNVLKCRPPGNRDPHPDEVATCSPYLDRQLSLLQPKVICTLGRHSTIRLTGQTTAMKAIRGQLFEYRGFKVMPTYHPAALLRNPSLKALVWEDVQKLRTILDGK
jgi:DNA polymerase